MDRDSWFYGFSQEVAGGVVLLIIAGVAGAIGMGWARVEEWWWAAPVLYALVTAVCLYFVIFGIFLQGIASPSRRGFGVVMGVLLLLFCTLWYVDEGSQEPDEVSSPGQSVSPAPSAPPAPAVTSVPTTSDQVKDREMGSRRANQKFSALLRDFPANNSLFPLAPMVIGSKKVRIRANKSSYAQAKVFGRWFREAQWEVVEVADTLTERFPSGITIRAPYNNGDAESIHVALCKLGYKVNRELPEMPLTVGVLSPSLDFITIEIGDLFS
jgi:hypothetical protein